MTNILTTTMVLAAFCAAQTLGQPILPVASVYETETALPVVTPPPPTATTTTTIQSPTTFSGDNGNIVNAAAIATYSKVPGFVPGTPFPGDVFAGDADAASQSNPQGITANAYPSGGLTANGMRIAIGGIVDPNSIPNDYFTTFDVRPGVNGHINGFQAAQPWTGESAKAATGSSSIGSDLKTKQFVITSDSEMVKALSVAVNVNGAYLGNVATVQSSFGYSQNSQSTSHRVSGLAMGIATQQGIMLAHEPSLQLTPQATAALTTDVNQFLDTYGTHFIKTKVYGCQATALYTFSCATQSAASDIAASLQANYNGGTFSIGGGVNSTFSQYQKENICTYDGSFQATGLGPYSIGASSSQLMNSTLMDGFWLNFGGYCQEAYQGNSGQLLYVELGNWMEVPAVANAISNNGTAKDLLSFYATFQPADLTALMMGGMYEYSIDNAVGNVNANLPGVSTPFANVSLLDRNGLFTDGPSASDNYYTKLPTAHANIENRLQSSRFPNFFNPSTISSAISSYQPASSLVKSYWNAIQKLYTDASAVYQYVYTDVSAVFRSFDNTGTPISVSLDVPVNANCQGQVPGFNDGDVYHSQMCAYRSIPVGSGSALFGISGSQAAGTPYSMANLWTVVANSFYGLPGNAGASGSVDFTAQIPNNPNKIPVRVDFSFNYAMADTSLYARPY